MQLSVAFHAQGARIPESYGRRAHFTSNAHRREVWTKTGLYRAIDAHAPAHGKASKRNEFPHLVNVAQNAFDEVVVDVHVRKD